MRSSLFWDVTQHRIVCYRRFGTAYRSYFKGQVLDCLNPGFVKICWSRCRPIRTDGHDI